MDNQEGRGPWLQRRARERGAHSGMQKDNISPKLLAWKTRGIEFCEFLQPVGHKAWNFEGRLG